MSQQMAHDKRVQAALSTTAAVAGLSALGLKGAGTGTRQVLRRSPALAARLRATPQLAERADKGSVGLVTIGAGVGGASGLKFAALQRKEAKREVRKDYEAGLRRDHIKRERDLLARGVAVRHGQVPPRANTVDREQASLENRFRSSAQQRPVKAAPRLVPKRRKDYGGIDPESNRQRRMKAEGTGLAVGAAGAGALAAGYGRQAVTNSRMASSRQARSEHLFAQRDRFRNLAWQENAASTYLADRRQAAAHSRHAIDLGNAARRIEGQVPGLKAVARARGKQAVVAGTAAAVLGAGAAGMHRMRTKGQGRHYRDWWDG